MDGHFVIPDKRAKMGKAEGYNVMIEHLKTLAFFGVGDIIREDKSIKAELLTFNLVLLI